MVFDPNETSGHVPTRVMAVLENPDVHKLMHWEPDGKSFRVTNPDLFTESVLANHFKGVKFGSFQRSLQREFLLNSDFGFGTMMYCLKS